ncbi:MAG: oligosaccharide repeat unit polymerase [Bacteroidetes bacterium]|nr:oligosaccharide repeat unit polymerase [Bacteroidota bacterium]
MSLFKLNTVSYVFYFQIITSAFVGSILLATGSIDYHPMVQGISYGTKISAWAWVMYSMLTLPLAMLFLNYIFRFQPKAAFNDYLNKPFDFQSNDFLNKMILSGMVLFAILILWYIFHYTNRIPIITLLTENNPEQAGIDRVDSKRSFSGLDYIKNLGGVVLVPTLAYFSYIFMVKKKNFFYVICFLFLFFISTVLLIYDIQKAPVAFFLFGFLILHTFLFGGVSAKKFLIFTGLGIGLLLLGYQYTSNVNAFDQFTRFNSAFYGRIFISGYLGFPLSLELFPEIIKQPTYQIGLPGFILNFLNLENTESARLLMAHINPEGYEKGSANLVSSYFLGEAYANYGYIGLLIAPLIVGFVVQSVHIFLLKRPKDPLLLAFYASITVKWLLGAGFVSFLYLKIIFFPLVLYFLVKIIINTLKHFSKETAT